LTKIRGGTAQVKLEQDTSIARSGADNVAAETVVETGGVIPAVLSGAELDEMGVVLDKSDADGEIYVIVGGADDQNVEAGEMMVGGQWDVDDDGEERHVNCPECGKAFSKISFLQVHLRSHAGGEKPFECDRCGRSFSQRANLHRHYQGHIGEKPHLCHLCGRAFVHKVQLSEHMAQEHAGAAVSGKRFTCRICQQAFAERGHLRQHAVKAHPNEHREAVGAISEADRTHVCDTCGRGYTTLGALRMHMRIHTGDVMACSFCDKTYVNRALLEQHLRTHTREKAFECRQCGKVHSGIKHLLMPLHLLVNYYRTLLFIISVQCSLIKLFAILSYFTVHLCPHLLSKSRSTDRDLCRETCRLRVKE